MKNLKNNKGFSLVELIIVVAIMAILIGILAPQYIKYVEKSRVSADEDVVNEVRKACEVAVVDPDTTITAKFVITFDNKTTQNSKANNCSISGDKNAATELQKIVDLGNTTMKSKQYKGTAPVITVDFVDNIPSVSVTGLGS